MYLFRLFLTLSHTFSHNLTLSAFESQFLKSIEHLNSCKRLSSVHLKRACEVAIFIFLKNKQGVVCGTKFSSRVGRNVDSQQTFFVFQDVFKMSWRRLQDVFAIRLSKIKQNLTPLGWTFAFWHLFASFIDVIIQK